MKFLSSLFFCLYMVLLSHTIHAVISPLEFYRELKNIGVLIMQATSNNIQDIQQRINTLEAIATEMGWTQELVAIAQLKTYLTQKIAQLSNIASIVKPSPNNPSLSAIRPTPHISLQISP